MRAALLGRILGQSSRATAGSVLPPERILATELATSRVTLRQATAALADWGLVESLLEDGYRMVAPKRALKQLDEQSG